MSDPVRYTEPSAKAGELNEAVAGLAPADIFDPVISAYKKDVDRTILRENLKLSPQQRSEKFVSFMKSVWQLRAIAEEERRK
jgi:hypothetical protein